MHKRELFFKLFACVLLIIKVPPSRGGRKTESRTKTVIALLAPTNIITVTEIATITIMVILAYKPGVFLTFKIVNCSFKSCVCIVPAKI